MPVTGVLSKSQLWLKSIQAFYGPCTHQRYQISDSMDGRFQYFLSPAISYWGIFQCCVRAQVLTLFLLAFALQIKLNEYDNYQFIAIWEMRACFPICLQRAIKESAKTPKALTSELNGNRCLFEIDRIIAAIHSYLTKIPTTMWREYGQVFAQRPILSNLTLRELRTASPIIWLVVV